MATKSKKRLGVNKKSLANLIPAKPGEIRNPKGRPKKDRCIPDILRAIGEEAGTTDGELTKLDVVMRNVYKYAVQGKQWAVQFIADRTEGKAFERVAKVSFTPEGAKQLDDLLKERDNAVE